MGWPMGQPKDEQPAPEMRCNATARYCVPKYDVASPWQQQKAARDPLVAGELEPHSKGAGRIITKAKRRELVGTLARQMQGPGLVCKVKAKHALLGPARPRQRKKGRVTMWGVL